MKWGSLWGDQVIPGPEWHHYICSWKVEFRLLLAWYLDKFSPSTLMVEFLVVLADSTRAR